MRPQGTLAWFFVGVLLARGAGAQPWTIAQCVRSSEEGQLHLQRGRLLEAKSDLERCSHSSCPELVQQACTTWLDDVLKSTPTLTVVARVDGVDQPQAQVSLDGAPWLSELTGKPQPIDPGAHRVSITVGAQSQEQRLVVNVGEKNRLVVFAFTVLPPMSAPVMAPATPGRQAAPAGGLLAPVALSGASLLGLATFAGLGLGGRASQSELLASPCAATKTCDPAAVAAIRRQYAVADVALALGVVSAGLAAWQWWSWAAKAPVSISVVPIATPNGQLGPAIGIGGLWE